jgi:hypothetical protein
MGVVLSGMYGTVGRGGVTSGAAFVTTAGGGGSALVEGRE